MMDPIIPTTPSKGALEATFSRNSGLATENGFEETKLKRDRFNAWSVIGIQFSITAAPLAVLSYVGLVTGVGGTSYFFWCYVVSIVGQLLVAASLAEIAAILPHASGQAFWVGALSPPKPARFLSYLVGFYTVLAWILGCAGAAVYTGNFIVSFGMVVSSAYIPEIYQIYLLTLVTLVAALGLNTYGVRSLPWINKFMVVYLNCAGFYIFVVLLAKATPKSSAHSAFLEVVNTTGWSSNGFVFLLGFLPGLLTMSVPDAAAHMAEELLEPERTVPLAIFVTCCLNAFGGLLMVITLIFCTVHPENLLHPTANQAAVQLIIDAWDNRGWLITVTLILVSVNANATMALLTGASRLLWTFARSGGLHPWFARSHERLQVPVIAVGASALLATLLSLLVFGPYTVLNGIFGCSLVCANVSYWLPIFFMCRKDRSALPEKRYFNLGKAGPVINVLALAWLTLTEVALCLPTYYPVTAANMNWASVVFFGLTILILSNWFLIKDQYQVPRPIYVERLHGQ